MSHISSYGFLFTIALALGFFPSTAAEVESAEELEIVITTESSRCLGSDVTLQLVFVSPPDPLTDDDANPGKNTVTILDMVMLQYFACVTLFQFCQYEANLSAS